MAAIDFVHHPHPHTEERKLKPPPKLADEHIGINGRLGASITRRVGTMWAFYLAAVTMAAWMVLAGFAWGPLHQIDPYPFAFLLFLGNIVQLLLMFVIMVGQQVLGAASDKRAVVTYQDAEAILHECLQMQEHLTAQDGALVRMIHRMEQLDARMEKSAG
jgi:Predicted membrane protein